MPLGPQLPLLYTVAVGLSVFCVVLYIGFAMDDYREQRLGLAPAEGTREAEVSVLFRVLKPLAGLFGHLVAAAIAKLARRFGEAGMVGHFVRLRVRLQRLLVSAGSPEGLTADELIGLHCVGIAFWGAVGVLVWASLGTSFFILVGLVFGFMQPFMWLRGRISRRRNEIRKLMPYALDLLTLSVEAGLDFTAALGRLAPKLGNSPLAEEFGEMLRQIRLGRSRAEALREMSDRVGMGEVTAFCSSLIQADQLGADLGPVLRVLADQMRQDRSNRAEKKAMEAPVKILFPLIAFIFPTVFIILFGPLGAKYLQDIFGRQSPLP